jgi:hypothetical protein
VLPFSSVAGTKISMAAGSSFVAAAGRKDGSECEGDLTVSGNSQGVD